MRDGPPTRAVAVAAALERAAALLDGVRDVVAERVSGPAPPAWVRRRGWEDFLSGLGEAELRRAEAEGLERVAGDLAGAPADLVALAREVQDLAAATRAAPAPDAPAPLRRASSRKRGQVAALVALCRDRLPPPRRVVDVGAGRGHLTRGLAAALGVPCVGLERDPARVAAAVALNEAAGPEFAAVEVGEALPLEPGDLAVGLHACGDLGDVLVRAAAAARVDVVLVNCCLQKVKAARRTPASAQGRAAGLELPRAVLGLTNLVTGTRGIELSTSGALEARRVRHAVRLLLAERGVDLQPGQEMRGLHRRDVYQGLEPAAARACARRGLEPPGRGELARVDARATTEHARVRRWSLPRNMLGRVLELALVLDRARALEDAGHTVTVGPLFPLELSPRNLGVVARAP